jgi:hypothetical protein
MLSKFRAGVLGRPLAILSTAGGLALVHFLPLCTGPANEELNYRRAKINPADQI